MNVLVAAVKANAQDFYLALTCNGDIPKPVHKPISTYPNNI